MTVRVEESVRIARSNATGGMRLLRPFLGAIVRSGLKKDLQKLKAILEQRQ